MRISGKKWMKIILCVMALGAVLVACTSCGTSTAGEGERIPESEARYIGHTFTLKEYVDAAPRIMVIDRPEFISKNGSVDKLYLIENGTVTVKLTVSGYKSLGELQELEGDEWVTYLSSIAKITYGELAKMSRDELWDYARSLETEQELPLTFNATTDNSGNRVVWEEMSGLSHGKMMYRPDREVVSESCPVYGKYLNGFAISGRSGFFFLSDEDERITLDSVNTPGIRVD